MVPLADIFNHRSAILPLTDGLGIEGMDDVDHARAVDNRSNDIQQQTACDDASNPVNTVSGIVAARKDNGRKRRKLSAPNEVSITPDKSSVRDKLREVFIHEKYPLNIAICNQEETTFEDGALEIILMHPVTAGEEIWNTYGELSSGALLMK